MFDGNSSIKNTDSYNRASSAVASITGGSQTSGATSASSISSASSQISSATSSGSASGVTSSATGSATSAVGSASSSNGGILSSLRATATSIGQSGSAANALTDGYSNTLLVQVAALAALFVASFVVMLA